MSEQGDVVINIENLRYKYPGKEEYALDGINLKVRRGEIVLITGRSGAGKSTLCYTLNGLVPQFFGGTIEGKVSVLGYDTTKTPVGFMSSKVGILFSEPASQLISATVEDEVAFPLENLGLSVEEINRRVEEALRFVGMLEYRDKPPYTLSGGQQQAVALATVLAMKPEIYVLDEPTSALDPIGTLLILELFKKIAKTEKKTFIIVEHKLEEFSSIVDRVVVMDKGKIVAEGSPREVLGKKAEFLKKLGLESPQVSLFIQRLKEKLGINDDETPISIEEGVEWMKKHKKIIEEHLNPPSNRIDEANTPRNVGKKIIEVRDLVHIYPTTQTVALKGVSLDVYEGEMLAIIGHNGSGKTTLVKHFNGLLKPTKGYVKVYGRDTRTTPMYELIKLVGYVFQDPDKQIFSRRVYDELAFGPRNLGYTKEEVDRIVKDVAKTFGLDKYLNSTPFSLSRGDRQKVAIASILALNPKVLVVDEPTTGQDPTDRRIIMDLMKKLNKEGKTIVFITHDMNLVAEYASRVVVLHNGVKVMEGTPREIFSRVEELKKLKLKPPSITELFIRARDELSIDLPLPLTVDEALSYFK